MGRFGEALVSLTVGLTVLVLISSCRDSNLVEPDRNRAPETTITGAPRQMGTDGVRVHFYWKGWDVDGVIVSYEVAIDDTSQDAWFRTRRSDSIFLFQVLPEDRDVEHTFYVAAIDNEQKRDPTPASRTFTAIDREPPLVDDAFGSYYLPGGTATAFANGDTVPANPGADPFTVSIGWTASDMDGEVVRFHTRFENEEEQTLEYQDTTTIVLPGLVPKLPEDRTEYALSITAEDDAGLYGGGGIAGVEPFRFEFTVGFTPRMRLRQIVAKGTRSGVTWNPVTRTFSVSPPETLTFSAADLLAGAVTFPAQSGPEFYWSAFDPEETCVKDVRWEADPDLIFEGTRSVREITWQAATCDGDSSRGILTNIGQFDTDTGTDTLRFATSPFSSAKRIFLRARDGFDRLGEYGISDPGAPIVRCLVNFLPTVGIDRVTFTADSVYVTWFSEDRDDPANNIRYEVSLDGGSFTSVTVTVPGGAAGALGRKGYRQSAIGSGTHEFRVRCANDLGLARFSLADTTFDVP